MTILNDFKKASKDVQKLSKRPDNNTLLELYSLYKQGQEGDISGSRPGLVNVRARKKYDAWAKIKGMKKDMAMKKYVKLVKKLQKELG